MEEGVEEGDRITMVPHRLENLFRRLLPPACREHVLGDLHEKCKSRREYVITAASVLAPVIISRIRRTTDFQLFLMESFAVYLSFSAAEYWLGQRSFLYDQAGFVRLAIPTLIAVIGLLMCNAYADPEKQPSIITPILESAGSLAFSFLGQAVIFDTRPGLAVPFSITLCGSLIGLVSVSTLRLLFRPLLNRQSKTVFLSQRFQPPNLILEKAVVHRTIRRLSDTQPHSKLKIKANSPLLLTAALLLIAAMSRDLRAVISLGVIALILVLYQFRA